MQSLREPTAPTKESCEPWPLATNAPYRLFAWPRYDSAEELSQLFEQFGPYLQNDPHLCLCLRYDPQHDGPPRAATALLQETATRVLGDNCRLTLLLVNESLAPSDWPRLGAAVNCVVALPSARREPRAACIEAMQAPLVSSVAELDTLLQETTPFADGSFCEESRPPRTKEREALMQYWLEKARQECAPYLPPLQLDICVTTACNLKCGYCWQQEKTGSRLTFDKLAELVDSISVIRPPRMLFTGGEPTVWPDFERLVAYCRSVGVEHIKLVTNGLTLRNYEVADRIISAGITEMNVSVDTFDAERFESIRGYKFSEFERILTSLSRLKSRYPYLNISLASVISRVVTPEDIHAVKKYCARHGLYHFVQTFFPTEYPEVNARFQFKPGEEQQFKAKLDWLGGVVGEVVKREANPLTETAQARCYKGVGMLKVHEDGGVKFCWKSARIGNILEQSFAEIWTSPTAREVREYIRDRKCQCDFDCDIFESLMLPYYANGN